MLLNSVSCQFRAKWTHKTRSAPRPVNKERVSPGIYLFGGICKKPLNGVVEQAVEESEEGARERDGAAWRAVQGELWLGRVAE